MLNIAVQILGVVYILLLSLGFWQFVHHPSKIPLLDRNPFVGVEYGWWSPKGRHKRFRVWCSACRARMARRDLSGPVLRDTARLSQRYPPIARYGVFGVSTWPIGCDTPSPFPERFPLGEHAKWRCDKGISAIPARYPMKTRQMGAIPISAILSRKGIARYGGVSRIGPLRKGWPEWASPASHDI